MSATPALPQTLDQRMSASWDLFQWGYMGIKTGQARDSHKMRLIVSKKWEGYGPLGVHFTPAAICVLKYNLMR